MIFSLIRKTDYREVVCLFPFFIWNHYWWSIPMKTISRETWSEHRPHLSSQWLQELLTSASKGHLCTGYVPYPCSVISYWYLEISHGENIYAEEILANAAYKSPLPSPSEQFVKHFPTSTIYPTLPFLHSSSSRTQQQLARLWGLSLRKLPGTGGC